MSLCLGQWPRNLSLLRCPPPQVLQTLDGKSRDKMIDPCSFEHIKVILDSANFVSRARCLRHPLQAKGCALPAGRDIVPCPSHELKTFYCKPFCGISRVMMLETVMNMLVGHALSPGFLSSELQRRFLGRIIQPERGSWTASSSDTFQAVGIQNDCFKQLGR